MGSTLCHSNTHTVIWVSHGGSLTFMVLHQIRGKEEFWIELYGLAINCCTQKIETGEEALASEVKKFHDLASEFALIDLPIKNIQGKCSLQQNKLVLFIDLMARKVPGCFIERVSTTSAG